MLGGHMKQSKIESFIERVTLESTFHKFLKEDIIYQIIDYFKQDNPKKEYSKKIENPLKIALQFYKHYNIQYYQMILDGIRSGKILIDDTTNQSYVETGNNRAFIHPFKNDFDLFMFVHEFAHFIDRNLNPTIIPNAYDFLCEVFAFYMEKQLELWLDEKVFHDLIQTRRQNRMYFEASMTRAIEYELYCETLYKKLGYLKVTDLDYAKIKSIMQYDYDLHVRLINYLLRYPLANILSDYLIHHQLVKKDTDICEQCLQTNLYEVLEEASQHRLHT